MSSAKKLSMQRNLADEYGGGMFFYVRAKLLSKSYQIAEGNPNASEDELRKMLKRELRPSLSRKQYGAIPWLTIIWWVLPSLIEWFLKQWFKDTK